MAIITVIILTFNEEQHIERCINSVKNKVDEIIVVDSFSKDKTTELAIDLGARVYQNTWVNYASQFNWALENCKISSEWVWRLDADEFIETNIDLRTVLSNLNTNVSGIYVKRKVVFMNKTLLHGGWYPVHHLKIWRKDKGSCENRWMDEHIKLTEGETVELNIDQVDENLNDLFWWISKHNSYATREMVDLLDTKYEIFSKSEIIPKLFGNTEQKKRYFKLKYLNLPLFIRPFFYFIYRYFFKLGLLDGKSGLIWHVLQGFWYRFLVDAKIYELNLKFNNDRDKIIDYLKKEYQIF